MLSIIFHSRILSFFGALKANPRSNIVFEHPGHFSFLFKYLDSKLLTISEFSFLFFCFNRIQIPCWFFICLKNTYTHIQLLRFWLFRISFNSLTLFSDLVLFFFGLYNVGLIVIAIKPKTSSSVRLSIVLP